jgi:hypothetical protein
VRLPPSKTGTTWRLHPHRTPRPRCSPSRSPQPNVAPQKPRLSRMANPQHRKFLGVNDQRFPFLVHKRFHFIFFFFCSCFVCHLLPETRLLFPLCIFPTGRFEDSFLLFAVRYDFIKIVGSDPFIVYNLHIFLLHSFPPNFSALFFSLSLRRESGTGLIVGLAGLLLSFFTFSDSVSSFFSMRQ